MGCLVHNIWRVYSVLHIVSMGFKCKLEGIHSRIEKDVIYFDIAQCIIVS